MKCIFIVLVWALSLGNAFADGDFQFASNGCGYTALTEAQVIAGKASQSQSDYWFIQNYVTKEMGASYDVLVRNRDDGRCLLINVKTFEGPNYCKVKGSSVTQLPNADIRDICKQ